MINLNFTNEIIVSLIYFPFANVFKQDSHLSLHSWSLPWNDSTFWRMDLEQGTARIHRVQHALIYVRHQYCPWVLFELTHCKWVTNIKRNKTNLADHGYRLYRIYYADRFHKLFLCLRAIDFHLTRNFPEFNGRIKLTKSLVWRCLLQY